MMKPPSRSKSGMNAEFPCVHSASSAAAERHKTKYGCSHSSERRRCASLRVGMQPEFRFRSRRCVLDFVEQSIREDVPSSEPAVGRSPWLRLMAGSREGTSGAFVGRPEGAVGRYGLLPHGPVLEHRPHDADQVM